MKVRWEEWGWRLTSFIAIRTKPHQKREKAAISLLTLGKHVPPLVDATNIHKGRRYVTYLSEARQEDSSHLAQGVNVEQSFCVGSADWLSYVIARKVCFHLRDRANLREHMRWYPGLRTNQNW